MTDDFIPLSVPRLRGNEIKYLTECIETEWVSSVGSFVTRFEENIARTVGVKHAVACVNGTAALHVALLLAGVGSEDEVIVPTITFIAPINTVRYAGAHPVFMDCDDSLNLDPQKLSDFLKTECEKTAKGLINKTSRRIIRAVVPVHVFGHPRDLKPILALTQSYSLSLIEDATESLGSFYKDWQGHKKMTGAVGEIGCLSFNGNKLITTGGGGMIVTDRKDLADRARYLTTQAKDDALYFRHDEVGYNYRMTNLQAAVGVAQIEELENFLKAKRKNFEIYRENLSGISGLSFISEPSYAHSNHWHYGLVVESTDSERSRDGLMKALKSQRIESRPLWFPNHRQKPYVRSQAYRIEKADRLWEKVLNIPCSVGLSTAEIERVIGSIRAHYGRG